MAIFILTFTVTSGTNISLSHYAIAGLIGLIIWSVCSVAERFVFKEIIRRIISNIFPTVILLSEVDCREYQKVRDARSTTFVTMFQFVGSIVLALFLNVSASYIYAYFTRP